MSSRSRNPEGGKKEISILLVDDIPETRESIRKLLAFEPDLKVVGSAGTGREGVKLAKELRPNIIIMDINMPDMDGLEATSIINKEVPTSAVIIMSVQSDSDYIRRAMRAGASDFLTKPINMDEIYSTIRSVYKDYEAERRRWEQDALMGREELARPIGDEESGVRAGNIIAVYSPQGGAGTTTVATSLASGLMRENVRVLLVDADLQFADVGTFLNLQPQSTIVDLVEDVDDLDVELFENIVVSHDSGLRILMGPGRPEFADEVTANPDTVSRILTQVAGSYDFIVVDTCSALNETLLSIFDVATKIVLVTTPTLTALRHLRFILDLFDQLDYEPEKACLVLNRVWDERKGKSATISSDRIQSFLKRPILGEIPAVDERVLLRAINKGVPIIASDRNQNNPPIRQLLDLAEAVFQELTGEEEVVEDESDEEATKKRKKIW
jgi:pilus assembly protein CpaE